jgi:solute carrier family 10 (sodium/bile acid cotransporter), member 7
MTDNDSKIAIHQPPRAINQWLSHNWFLVLLIAVLVIGLSAHQKLDFLIRWKLAQDVLVFAVMFMMALPIRWQAIHQSLTKPWPAILGAIINMGFIPALAFVFSRILPAELGNGLIVAAAVPCTIASAAVWTRKADGDETVAVLITLITNIACAVVTPLWMRALLSSDSTIDVRNLMLNLAILVVLPIALAQFARSSNAVQSFAQREKTKLGNLCQIGILVMVLTGAVQMGIKLFEGNAASMMGIVASFTIVAVMVLSLHLIAMGLGWYVAGLSGIARPQQIAVAIGGSQKTLMVGLKLAIDAGASILPMVAFHVLQLIVDTMIARKISNANVETKNASLK